MPAYLTPIDELDQNTMNLCTRINAATNNKAEYFVSEPPPMQYLD